MMGVMLVVSWMLVLTNVMSNSGNAAESYDLQGAICGRWFSLNTRERSTPTPSNTPRRIPQAIAEPSADLGPPAREKDGYRKFRLSSGDYSLLAARQPPVMNPEMIAFHASSFCRQPLTAQSNVENIPPHIPKLPPVTGARAFMEEIAPTKRSPWIETLDYLRGPLCRRHIPVGSS